MKRWRPVYIRGEMVSNGNQFVENAKIDAFLDEIDTVCEKHGFDISHEDGHGCFEVVDRGFGGSVESAHDCTSSEKSK